MGNRSPRLMLFLILLLGIFFRFWHIKEIPPGLDTNEAANGNNALEALATGDFKVFYREAYGREGLFINIQALALSVFGNVPWALRVVSAVFGLLTIAGLYALTRELLRYRETIESTKEEPPVDMGALFASFFLATSFWHISASRIGLRQISVPFFLVFGTYFLLKALRRGKISSSVLAGLFHGLGFHTYPAYRFAPLIAFVPVAAFWQKWRKERTTAPDDRIPCTSLRQPLARDSLIFFPRTITVFLVSTLLAALPIGIYFLQQPSDLVRSAGHASSEILNSAHSWQRIAENAVKTIGMFHFSGDRNWRHNLAGQPQLHPVVGIFFVFGLFFFLREIVERPKDAFLSWTLLFWLFVMLLPGILTDEAPHALRTIGAIPPVMIMSGIGAARAWELLQQTLKNAIKHSSNEERHSRLKPIVLASRLTLFAMLAFLTIHTYRAYFTIWAEHQTVRIAFRSDLVAMGDYLNTLPENIPKYVIKHNRSETIRFITGTFRESLEKQKNLYYLSPDALSDLRVHCGSSYELCIVIIPWKPIMRRADRITAIKTLDTLKTMFPSRKFTEHDEFIVMK